MAFDFKFPDVGEGIHEGKIVKWLVKEGDSIKVDDPLAEVETDKAIVEIPSPKTGKITKLYHQESEIIKVGEVLASIEESGASATPQISAQPIIPSTTKSAISETPQTEIIKTALPVQPAQSIQPEVKESTGVVGALEETAPGVLKAPPPEMSGAIFTEPQKQEGSIGTVKAGLKAVKKYDLFGYIDRISYSGMRKTIGDHMVQSAFKIPQVTTTEIADMQNLWDLRDKEKKQAEKEGIKLTFMAYFLKAIQIGLQKHPYLNATLDEQANEIIIKKYFNIGIAVDTEAGLMVPVVKGVDKKTIFQLAQEIQNLAEKARSRKINPMDLKGGTFTISNIGSAGGGFLFTPLINYPEAAILGVGMITDTPVAVDGKLNIHKVMGLSLSFDHRIVDGALATRFLAELKHLLENPKELTEEVKEKKKAKPKKQ